MCHWQPSPVPDRLTHLTKAATPTCKTHLLELLLYLHQLVRTELGQVNHLGLARCVCCCRHGLCQNL